MFERESMMQAPRAPTGDGLSGEPGFFPTLCAAQGGMEPPAPAAEVFMNAALDMVSSR